MTPGGVYLEAGIYTTLSNIYLSRATKVTNEEGENKLEILDRSSDKPLPPQKTG